MAQLREKEHKVVSRFMGWILRQASKIVFNDCHMCSPLVPLSDTKQMSPPPERTLYQAFLEVHNTQNSLMTEEEQEAQATDLENSLAAGLDQDSARENATPIETTTSNFFANATSKAFHTKESGRRTKRCAAALNLDLSRQSAATHVKDITHQLPTISPLTAGFSSRSPTPDGSEESIEQKRDSLDSDTESSVSDTEAELTTNEADEAKISEKWESVLSVKESAHQTEIDILNDDHEAEKALIRKGYDSEVESLNRKIKVQRQTLEKKITKLTAELSEKENLLKSKDTLLLQAEADVIEANVACQRKVNEAGAENASLKAQLGSRIRDIQYLYILKDQYDSNMIALHNTHQWMVDDAIQGLLEKQRTLNQEIRMRWEAQEIAASFKNHLLGLQDQFNNLKAQNDTLRKDLEDEKSRFKSKPPPGLPFRKNTTSFNNHLSQQSLADTSLEAWKQNNPSPPSSPGKEREVPTYQRPVLETKTQPKQNPFGFTSLPTEDLFMKRYGSQPQGSRYQPTSLPHLPVEIGNKQDGSKYTSSTTPHQSPNRLESQCPWPQPQSAYQAQQETLHNLWPQTQPTYQDRQEDFQYPSPQGQPPDRGQQESKTQHTQPDFGFSFLAPNNPFTQHSEQLSTQSAFTPSTSEPLEKAPKDKKLKNKQRTALRKAAKARVRGIEAVFDADNYEKME